MMGQEQKICCSVSISDPQKWHINEGRLIPLLERLDRVDNLSFCSFQIKILTLLGRGFSHKVFKPPSVNDIFLSKAFLSEETENESDPSRVHLQEATSFDEPLGISYHIYF